MAENWKELERQDRELRKKYTCPVCRKRCHQFLGHGLPMVGCLRQGQWFCSPQHAKEYGAC